VIHVRQLGLEDSAALVESSRMQEEFGMWAVETGSVPAELIVEGNGTLSFMHGEGRIYIATVNGVPAGTLGYRHEDGCAIRLSRFCVRPAFQRIGVGRALLTTALADARIDGSTAVTAELFLPTMSAAKALLLCLSFSCSSRPGPSRTELMRLSLH
jgi:GNAT superfamily N-acetyltransferase